jgi:hypothetical protein
MTETKDRPTIGERYRRATQSSDLRVESRRVGDADLLIAAGWADSLGIMLYRLASEYDQVAAELRKAAGNDETAAVLILMHLKSLHSTKQALGRHAISMATRWKFMKDDKTVLQLTGRALKAWLDPNCHKCEGRGKNGGYDGKPVAICRACGGSGKSRSGLGESSDERFFIARLLADMDRRTAESEAELRKLMRAM